MKTAARVEDIMNKCLVTARPDSTLAEIRRLFHKYKINHLLVLEQEKVIGIISSNDLIKAAFVKLEFPEENFCAGDIMQKEIMFIVKGATIKDAAQMFAKNHFHSLPVLDSAGNLQGIITVNDLINVIAGDGSCL